MEARNCLGILLSKERATAVCRAAGTGSGSIIGCLTVSLEESQKPTGDALRTLCERLAAGCKEKGFKFSDAAIALDCALFMQHSVHSEFTDPRKIAATVRFDTEEALATDVSDTAIAFRIESSGESGTDLTVFTAEQKTLSDIIVGLQSNGIDPVTIEPDVCCLGRHISSEVGSSRRDPSGALFAMLSQTRGYLVGLSESGQVTTLRTFLVGAGQDRPALLVREILIGSALGESSQAQAGLAVWDSAGGIPRADLSEGTGMDVAELDLVDSAELRAIISAGGADPVDFAIANGAALAASEKTHAVNFRDDFMPYLGRKTKLRKAAVMLSVALTLLFVALGIHVQLKLMDLNGTRAALRDKLGPDYLSIVFGDRELPGEMKTAVAKLGRVLRHLEKGQGTVLSGDNDTITAKLTLIFKAFNSCAAQTGLNVDSVLITSRSITLTGDTDGRPATLKLEEALKTCGLPIETEHLNMKDNRDTFSLTIKTSG